MLRRGPTDMFQKSERESGLELAALKDQRPSPVCELCSEAEIRRGPLSSRAPTPLASHPIRSSYRSTHSGRSAQHLRLQETSISVAE